MGIDFGNASGRGTLGALVTLAALGAAGFAALRFYEPYKDFWVVESELKAAAQHCVTLSQNDKRCLETYDSALAKHGITFPKSGDIQWVRLDQHTIEIGFAYDEDVDLKVTKHTLKFRFHCKANPGGCVNDAR